MKKILSLFILLYLFVGCGVVKKTASSASTEVTQTKTSTDSSSVSTFVDTTKTGSSTISIIKIEFYPDNGPVTPAPDSTSTGEAKGPETAPERPVRPSSGGNTINVNGKTISGNIKSAEIVEIKTDSEEKGVSSSEAKETVSSDEKTEAKIEEIKTETPQKDPRRFLWLAILIGVGLVAFLVVYYKFLKPLGIADKVRNILSRLFSFRKNT